MYRINTQIYKYAYNSNNELQSLINPKRNLIKCILGNGEKNKAADKRDEKRAHRKRAKQLQPCAAAIRYRRNSIHSKPVCWLFVQLACL